jgi:PKHD-type hydroxylase
VVYPSTTINEVHPVRSGERLVAITLIQSQIVDEKKRDLLYTLNEVAALEGLTMKWENRILPEHVLHSLHRMWSA